MTFTPWLRILNYGEAPPATPYAIFSSYFTRYALGWQEPSWRYDRATGQIEYRGLIASTASVPAASQRLLSCVMPLTPNLPRPPLHMFGSVSTHGVGGAVISENLRIDCNPNSAYGSAGHHDLNVELTGGNAMSSGQWFWLGDHTISCSNHNPEFGPWARANSISGQTCFSAYWNIFGGWGEYPGGWCAPMFRCSPDYRRWQWRGLFQNTSGAAINAQPNVIDIAHPAPILNQQILNLGMTHVTWSGGQSHSVRIDCSPNTYGHKLNLISPKAVASGWLSLNLDYDLQNV